MAMKLPPRGTVFVDVGIDKFSEMSSISTTTAPEFIRVKRRRDEDSVQALCMCRYSSAITKMCLTN